MKSIHGLLVLAATGFAQYAPPVDNSPAASSSTSSSASAAAPTAPSGTHAVQIGPNLQFAFSPNSLTVPVNDTVEFFFYPPIHGVVQADFNTPCQPANDSAFSSGLIDVGSGVGPNTFKLKINNTAPIWFYCPQTTLSHCQSGMVGVINPPSGGAQTLAAFQAAAKKTTTSKMPANVQGGIISASDVNNTGSSGSSAPSGSAAASNYVQGGLVIGAVLGVVGLLATV